MMRICVFLSIAFAGQALAQPVINSGGIVNVSGNQPLLAPNVVFAVYGQNLGPASIVIASAPSYPSSLAGTSLKFTPTGGGAAIVPKLVFTESIAVAGVLPSTITPGTYAVQVTYLNQTSASQNVTVVARDFNIATANGIGTGTAQASIANVNAGYSLTRFTSSTSPPVPGTFTNTPAHSLDIISLWGTGGGADTANDTGGSSGDQTATGNFKVILGSQTITPGYAGAVAGYPGLWVVIFTVPAGITPDCFTPLQVSSNGQLSNSAILPIAATGQTSCAGQISTSTLSKLDSGGHIIDAVLSIGTTTSTIAGTTTVTEAVGALFQNFSASAFLPPFAGPVVGPCRIFLESFPVGGKPPTLPDSYLNAGTLTISGPGIPAQTVGTVAVTSPGGSYYYSKFPTGTISNGGTYTITGAGGPDIAPFSVTQTMPPSFAVTNFSSLTTINRTQPTTINWTGGGSGTVVITVQTLHFDSSFTNTFEAFVACTVPTSANTFTIPAAALAYLSPVTPGGSDFAQLTVGAGPAFAGGVTTGVSIAAEQFTPALTAGGTADFGSFASIISIGQSIGVQ